MQSEPTPAGLFFPLFDNSVTNLIEIRSVGSSVMKSCYGFNTNVALAYIQVFDAIAPVLGVTLPKVVLRLPPNGYNSLEGPMRFVNAIRYAATTTPIGTIAPLVPVQFGSICT